MSFSASQLCGHRGTFPDRTGDRHLSRVGSGQAPQVLVAQLSSRQSFRQERFRHRGIVYFPHRTGSIASASPPADGQPLQPLPPAGHRIGITEGAKRFLDGEYVLFSPQGRVSLLKISRR